MEWIETILKGLSSIEGMSATLVIVLELVFRVMPTKKPLSVLHIVGSSLSGLGMIFSKTGEILSKVLPQNSEEKE